MASLGVALALPLTLIHPVLPFAAVLTGYGVVTLFEKRHWLPSLPTSYLVGCLVALLLLLPTTSLVQFVEQGFDDGPFYGKPFRGVLSAAAASDRLDYRQGELLIYNRTSENPPILAYQVDGETRWAQSLDVKQNRRYQGYQLNTVAEPSLAYGIFRDRLDFVSTWNFGKERGRAYFWKWGKFHRFFLSW